LFAAYAAQIDRTVPVLFIDTEMLFAETLSISATWRPLG
jgi:3'-phosphoadenosine 5'-phosphosulfate sulfotransferase (PAPS reductase)/FAD synthetase